MAYNNMEAERQRLLEEQRKAEALQQAQIENEQPKAAAETATRQQNLQNELSSLPGGKPGAPPTGR